MEELCFRLGNDLVERQIYISEGVPYKSVITNKVSGMEWASNGKEPLLVFPGIDLKGSNVCLEENAILIQGADFMLRWEFRVFEDIPVIESRVGIKGKACAMEISGAGKELAGGDGVETRKKEIPTYKDYVDGLGCASKHVTLKAVTFFDRTDLTDYLLEEKEIPLYSRNAYFGCDGQLFVLKDELSKEECMIVKNAPCGVAHYNKKCSDLNIHPISNIHICGSGINTAELTDEYIYSYPVAIGVCGRDESTQLFRQYYETDYRVKVPYIMSNTWGDRNCDKCVCEDFILKEIDKAYQLGVDIVQIDDGWQKGITANSALVKGGCWTGGYRAADPEFWSVNPVKFPRGLDRIIEAAKEKRISIGLWFSPDSYNDYGSWELDGEVMLDFYSRYGIRHFKMDGIRVVNRSCEQNLIRMLTMVKEKSHGNVVFNMDITNGLRFGYLAHKDFGDIFVENRYTDWGNYYPHNTLRNLWELSRYLPTQRLQMELLNPRRNQDIYHDILAPAEYDMDYLFATVMTANPLVWMEMTGLDEECSGRLAQIISVYKNYREDFVKVTPILEKPSGFSLTGFKIYGKQQNYVLLFRELSDKGTFDISVKEILATNDEAAQATPVKLSKKRSYLFGSLL